MRASPFIVACGRWASGTSLSILLGVLAFPASAALFSDDEARRAILDLRQRLDAQRQVIDAQRQLVETQAQELRTAEQDTAQLRRGLIDLQSQIEALRAELARLRGQDEQLGRELSELQRRQKDLAQGLDERVRKMEPVTVTVDGREFTAEPAEARSFEAALATFRKGEFPAAQGAFGDFLRRYPSSGYGASARFWLGNAQYANREYREAITNFRALLASTPDHPRAPEAALSIANCQIELKEAAAARKTLQDLIKTYPQSEAAGAARERLSRLR